MSIYNKQEELAEHFDKMEIVKILKRYYDLKDNCQDEELILKLRHDLIDFVSMTRLVNYTKYTDRQLISHLLQLFGNELFDKQTTSKLKQLIKKHNNRF